MGIIKLKKVNEEQKILKRAWLRKKLFLQKTLWRTEVRRVGKTRLY